MPANWYVDASASGDANPNNATTPALAKQHLMPVMFFLNRTLDQNIWIKAGYYYDVTAVGAGMAGLVASHVKIRRYGTGGNPVIDGRNWIAPGSNRFTPEGPGPNGGFVWSLQIGTAEPVHRVFANSVNNGILLNQRTDGYGLRRIPDKAAGQTILPATIDNLAYVKNALKPECPWYGSGAGLGFKLYMLTPVDQDPATYFAGLSFIQAGAGTVGFDCAFRITQAQDILIQGLDFAATRSEAIVIGGVDTAAVTCCSIRILDCNFKQVLTNAVKVQSISSNAGIAADRVVVSDVLVKRCTMDVSSNALEQETDNDLYGRLVAASDLIAFFDRIDQVRAEDCIIINAYHTAAALGASDAKSSRPRRTGFRRIKAIASSWNAYARAYESKPCERSCFFDQVYAEGMNVRSQFVGAPLVTSPKFVGARAAIRKDGATDGHLVFETYIGETKNPAVTGEERYIPQEPEDVRIYNGTFGPSPGTPIQFNTYQAGSALGGGRPPAQFAAGTVTIKNALFLDTDPLRSALPVLSSYVEVPMGVQNVDNCAVYKGAGITPTVLLSGSTYNIAAAPGFVDIMTVNPMVDAQLQPLQNSPLIGNGKRVASKLRDITGREMKTRASIGAHEDFHIYNRTAR